MTGAATLRGTIPCNCAAFRALCKSVWCCLNFVEEEETFLSDFYFAFENTFEVTENLLNVVSRKKGVQ
jgi:hypothetical protein